MIVWLASYPRSGNTFFRIVLHEVYGLDTYSIYDDPMFVGLGMDKMLGQKRLPAPLEELAQSDDIYVLKTHDLPRDNNPAIYLVRDGRDSLVSFARFILSFEKDQRNRLVRLLFPRTFDQVLEGLIVTTERYGGWGGNVSVWKGRRDAQTVILKYEDFILDPMNRIKGCFEALSLPVKEEAGVPPRFDDLQKQYPDFFRKGRSGSWKSEMAPRLEGLFWREHGKVMEQLGYER